MRTIAFVLVTASALSLLSRGARADGPTGAPPPDAKALVEMPKDAAAVPTIAAPTHETNASVSAGGLMSTGNSQNVAATVNGKFDMRRGTDGFGASLVGNYAAGAKPGDKFPGPETTENVQGRIRYDRYLIDQMSLFLITTGRHDRFQGLDFRLNLDPGLKYLFVNADTTKLWAEAGYDFQYDVRSDDAVNGRDPATHAPLVDMMGNALPPPSPAIDKTKTDHSARVFAGFKHAFNKEVTFATGLEYLQSLVDSKAYRFNYDALIAANVGGGFSIGVGFGARYDNLHLSAKESLDTTTTMSLVYSFSDLAAPPAPPPPAPPAPPHRRLRDQPIISRQGNPMLKDFKAFIARGNVVDLAVGVIIGASFGKITGSLVGDVIMPPIGLVLGKVDFANLFIDLSGKGYETLAAAKAAGAPTINYGVFINSVIDFLIVAFVVFLLVQSVQKLMPKPEPPKTTRDCPRCFEAIAIKATRCPRCTSDITEASAS